MNPVYYVTVRHDGDDPTARHEPIRYDHFVRMLLKPDTIKMEGLHIILGLVGEWMEFHLADSWENAKEELGDLEFYFQAALLHVGVTEEELAPKGMIFNDYEDENALSELIDFAKKKYIYGQVISQDTIHPALRYMRAEMDKMARINGVTRQEILQANADKLSKRYKQLVFTTAESAVRADKAAPSNG